MNRITNIKIISHFINDGKTYGVYTAKFKGEDKTFIQNEGSFGVVSHTVGEPANKCVSIIRDDVAEELKAEIAKIQEVR
jgi:hypothetical protein